MPKNDDISADDGGQVAAGVAVDPSPDGNPPAVRDKGGAPKGNRNAFKHGTRGRTKRDGAHRKAERAVRAVLEAYGLTDDPMAQLVARQIRRLEAAADRIETRLNARGWFHKNRPETHAAVNTLISVTDRLLGEARALLKQLADLRQPSEASVTHTVSFTGKDGACEILPSQAGLPDDRAPALGLPVADFSNLVSDLREGEELQLPPPVEPSPSPGLAPADDTDTADPHGELLTPEPQPEPPPAKLEPEHQPFRPEPRKLSDVIRDAGGYDKWRDIN